jgi:hypothetical protein
MQRQLVVRLLGGLLGLAAAGAAAAIGPPVPAAPAGLQDAPPGR